MNDDFKISSCRFGAFNAMFAGFCYVIIAYLSFSLPPSIASYLGDDNFFREFQSVAITFINIKIVTIFANISMIGVVCSFLMLCRE